MCLISFWRCKGTAIFRTDNEFFAKSSKNAHSFDVNQGTVCEHTRFVCENTPFFHLYWQWSERSLLIHTKRITLQILHFRVSGWQNADAQGVCTLFGGWQVLACTVQKWVIIGGFSTASSDGDNSARWGCCVYGCWILERIWGFAYSKANVCYR